MNRYALSVAVAGALASFGLGAELKSGLQPGQPVPVFSPLNVNGPSAGEKQCPV